MPRSLRYVPAAGTLVEVTTRTVPGRLLLQPTPTVNEVGARRPRSRPASWAGSCISCKLPEGKSGGEPASMAGSPVLAGARGRRWFNHTGYSRAQ